MTRISAENDIFLKKGLYNLIFSADKKDKFLNLINTNLRIYKPVENRLSYGIFNPFPGSAYLDFYENKIFLISAVGIFGFSELNDTELNFNQIKNNIDEFLTLDQLTGTDDLTYNASIKDIKSLITRYMFHLQGKSLIIVGTLQYLKLN